MADQFPFRIKARSLWTDKPPVAVSKRYEPHGIATHHEAGPNAEPLTAGMEFARAAKVLEGIRKFHTAKRGWNDIAYNIFVSRGGEIIEARYGTLTAMRAGMVRAGAHAGTAEGNRHYCSICIEGNAEVKGYTMPQAQWDALVNICAFVALQLNVDTDRIVPHSHFHPTQCPGKWLLARMKKLKRAAHDLKVEWMVHQGQVVIPATIAAADLELEGDVATMADEADARCSACMKPNWQGGKGEEQVQEKPLTDPPTDETDALDGMNGLGTGETTGCHEGTSEETETERTPEDHPGEE